MTMNAGASRNGLAEKDHRGRRSSVMPFGPRRKMQPDSRIFFIPQVPKRSVHRFAYRKIAGELRSSGKQQGER
jgi:hypothetical protein